MLERTDNESLRRAVERGCGTKLEQQRKTADVNFGSLKMTQMQLGRVDTSENCADIRKARVLSVSVVHSGCVAQQHFASCSSTVKIGRHDEGCEGRDYVDTWWFLRGRLDVRTTTNLYVGLGTVTLESARGGRSASRQSSRSPS